jgi:hypothetical protein
MVRKISVAAFFVAASFTTVAQAEKLTARFGEKSPTSDKSKNLFVYSDEKISSVEHSSTKGWSSMKVYPKLGDVSPFGTLMGVNTDSGIIAIRAVQADGSRVTTNITFATEDGNKVVKEITEAGTESKEEVEKERAAKLAKQKEEAAKRAAQIAAADPLLVTMNATRARHGLPPCIYDPSLQNISYRNNAAGGGHVVMGGNGQIWAGTGSYQGAVNMWLNSSGHRVIMLSGRRYAGCAVGPGNQATCTFR